MNLKLIDKFLKKFSIRKKAKQYKIEKINLVEYKTIFINNNFKDTSHIQSPGYYLEKDYPVYIKVLKNKEVIAIAVFTKKKLFNIIPIMRLNDGPLVSNKYKGSKSLIINLILSYLKNNYSRLISIAPSCIYKKPKFDWNLITINLRIEPWKTSIIDLRLSKLELLQNLKQKWRNTLKKGLNNCVIREINDINTFQTIMKEYRNYSIELGFKAISETKCMRWFKNKIELNGLVSLKILQASMPNNPEKIFGSIGILEFKNKSLYLFGFTNKLGKKNQANSALLWEAIITSKDNNFLEFDLGGINKTTPIGIRKFKESLNGTSRDTSGEYLCIAIF